MKEWATGTRLESEMLSQNMVPATEIDALGAIAAVNFLHVYIYIYISPFALFLFLSLNS